MNLNQLRGFWETAAAQSMSRAAEKLYITQPALSLQIKALEEELGQQLFERQGRGLLLTDSGRFLQERSKEILDLVEQTEQEMSAAELMGIFYYYTHGIAESYRQEVLADQQSASDFQSE